MATELIISSIQVQSAFSLATYHPLTVLPWFWLRISSCDNSIPTISAINTEENNCDFPLAQECKDIQSPFAKSRRCGLFYGLLLIRPAQAAQRNESIHYVPQDRSKTARKKERACGRFRTSEPPANPHYSNKKATSFSADGFGPSGESRTHGLLNPIQARYQTALHPDVWPGVLTGDVVYYSPCNRFCQRRIFGFLLFTKVFQIFYS